MALNIEFEGYVNEVKEFGWGTVVKMSHNRNQKNRETGQWEIVGKDYLDVTLPEGSALPTEGQILHVTGTFKVDTFEKRDGSTGVGLKVRAEYFEVVERNYSRKPDSDPTVDAFKSAGVKVAEDMPF